MRNRLAISTVAAALASVALAPAQTFTSEAAAAPPEAVPADTRALVAPEGVAVRAGGEAVATFWMRGEPFEGQAASGFGVRFDDIPEGAFLGVVEFPAKGSDFREQSVPPGVYTIRFGLHPEDGNHMGVAPSRDFGLLAQADKDLDVARNYDFDALVELSAEVGNPHPTVLRLELPEGDAAPHLWENDYGHWVLDIAVGGTVVGVVVDGHADE